MLKPLHALGLLLPALAAADVPGGRDHPLISRYQGSSLSQYREDAHNEFLLPLGPAKHERQPYAAERRLAGRLTTLSYQLPRGHSTLEVYGNYHEALKGAGFETLYACADAECGGLSFNRKFLKGQAVDSNTGFYGNAADQRYLAVRLARAEGEVYAALYVVRNSSVGGPRKDEINTRLVILETAALATGKVTVDADAMSRAIRDAGRIALYGFHFDTGQAELQAESAASLAEIAKLLRASPELKLVIVGHTDNQGAMDYNLDLSKRRAQAVQAALIGQHGIDGARLKAWGAGYLAPVASNREEAGRALNRRVELVEQ